MANLTGWITFTISDTSTNNSKKYVFYSNGLKRQYKYCFSLGNNDP
jgi:hypothetical protein